ncbi:MAG: tetratricopeptide repeat protein [Gammaproteobacteria bacterium]|nr:tetratricopeptide repeat protein [Gammaproteobacteria bacterium]MDH4315211.1 tetratricopeptide repeat protein [Gammaproteobacteria bacterium]MDH5214422.1 tetratricopeptide repeat protein [Gammaproteobacteria bacterium]
MDKELLDGFLLKGLSVEPTTGQVTGAHGSRHIPSKAMEVLLLLARNSRRLVSREVILQKVWGDGHGSADALTHAVSEIRHALDDHASTPEFIQTVPTRGYRLLIEPVLKTHGTSINAVLPEPAVDTPRFWQALIRHGVVQASAAYLVVGWLLIQVADAIVSDIGLPAWSEQFITFTVIGGFPIVVLLAWFLEFSGGRMLVDDGQQSGTLVQGLERNYLAIFVAYFIAALGAGVYQATVGFDVPDAATATESEPVPVAENSLAVLKLATFDDDERMRVFSYGLSEDLIDALARLPGLSVSSRGDSWSLPVNANSELIRRRLRVAYFLEGSIRMLDADTMRVVVQLVDSATGFHIVSRGFDLQLESYANLQKEITSLVVANLRLALGSGGTEFAVLPAEDTTIDTYLLYRRGLEELYKPRSDSAIRAGIGYFEDALNIDGDYPAAHAGLCSAYTTLFRISRDPSDIDMAEDACARAYAVGPQLPLVLNAVGNLRLATGRNEQAKAMFEGALDFDERNAVAINGLAALAEREQRFDDAERLIRRAIELQPGNWRAMSTLAGLYFGTGRYAEAAQEYRKILFIDPDNFQIVGNLGAASLMAGEFATARDALERSLQTGFDPLIASNLGVVHYYLGDFAKSVEIHQQVIEATPKSSGSRVNLGDALHFLGDDEGATAAFTKAIELARADLGVNPDDPETLLYLAWSLAMTGSLDEGLRYANRALEIDAGDPYSYYYVGLILLQKGQPDAAVRALESALDNGYQVKMLAAEPYVQPLQADPRFKDLLANYGSKGEQT